MGSESLRLSGATPGDERHSHFSIQSSALVSKTSRRVFTPVQKAELIGLTQQGVCTEGFFFSTEILSYMFHAPCERPS